MKKALIWILLLSFILTFTACAKNNPAASPSASTSTTPLYDIYVAAYDGLKAGDASVIDKYFTADYTSISPESKLMTKTGVFSGRAALEAVIAGSAADGSAWAVMDFKVTDHIETADTLITHQLITYKNPLVPYAGFTLEPDFTMQIQGFNMYKFKDGKISSEIYTYDTLGCFYDLAKGDLALAGQKITEAAPFYQSMKDASK